MSASSWRAERVGHGGEGPQADTIFALSSGQGRAGVAVIRVSGPGAGSAARQLCRCQLEPRRAKLVRLRHPATAVLLDQALLLWFPAPGSFTGEDVAELHIHGGRAVIAAVLGALGEVAGLRLAEPGEFSRRAFENGKLDLTSAEGLADLINAETEIQRRQALRQATGAQRVVFERWRGHLLRALSLVEAGIDFSDEADISDDVMRQARGLVTVLEEEIGAHLADGHRGEIIRDGFKVVIMGAPNAGKSSLLNALARRDVAIVSTEAGTTRDVIEVALDLGGVRVLLSDTAGLRETEGAVEREGIRRALARAQEAQLVLWLEDGTGPRSEMPPALCGLKVPVLRIISKSDLLTGGVDGFAVSAKTGQGLRALEERLGALAQAEMSGPDDPLITRVRHRQELATAHQALVDFLSGDAGELELRAEDLRLAARALGRITGQVDVEEILGQIFSEFCIGK